MRYSLVAVLATVIAASAASSAFASTVAFPGVRPGSAADGRAERLLHDPQVAADDRVAGISASDGPHPSTNVSDADQLDDDFDDGDFEHGGLIDYSDVEPLASRPFTVGLRGTIPVSGNAFDNSAFMLSGTFTLDLDVAAGLPLLRAEAEVGAARVSIDAPATQPGASGDQLASFAFVSLYRDLIEIHRLRPFVGAGFGLIGMTSDDQRGDDQSDATFAWHISGGVALDWDDDRTLELGYRYIDIPGGGALSASELDGMHSVYAGMRLRL
ncbi:MAG: acyloxyacyl hydrolase [Pseudomonadota bacterium]